MSEHGLREQHLEDTRRRGYLVLCACAVLVHAAIAAGELPQGNWRAGLVALLCAALLPVILSRRVAVRQLDTLAVWSANIGAAYFVWDFYGRALTLGAREVLTVSLFLVVWFGLLPLRRAAVRGAALYLVLAVMVGLQRPVDPVPLLYTGFLLFLIGQMTVAGRQVQQERSRTVRYADLALTDALTGLLNRRSLERHLDEHYALQAVHQPLQPKQGGTAGGLNAVPAVGLLLIDIDLFKGVNDTYGHKVGDRVLVALGQTLRASARSSDLVARWGGEEFVVLVSPGDQGVLEQICGRIRQALVQDMAGAGLPPITVSIGAALSGEVRDAAGLLQLADRRLYRAKQAGRDQMNMDTLDTASQSLSDGFC